MNGHIHFYGAPLAGPLPVTRAVVGLVVHPDRVTLALDIASEHDAPDALVYGHDDDDHSDWQSPGAWRESLESIQLGNVHFDAKPLPTVLEPGARLSLARPSLALSLDSRDAPLYAMFFHHAYLIVSELRIAPAPSGFNLRWSGVVDDLAPGDDGRFLVTLDAITWDRVDLARIPPPARAAAIARWFDDTSAYELRGVHLVPRRTAPPARAKRPATVRLAFQTADGLAAAAAALNLAPPVTTPPGPPPAASARAPSDPTATLWLRPLSRRRGTPDFGFGVDVRDVAALESRPDGAVAIRFAATRPDALTLDLVTLDDPGARVVCAAADVHLQLDRLLDQHGGAHAAVRDAAGRILWSVQRT